MVTLMEGEWSRYRSLNGGKMVMLQMWSVQGWRMVMLGGGQFNGGRMVMLQSWPVEWENGHVTEVVTNGGRMVMLQKWSLMEGEWSCYRGGKV